MNVARKRKLATLVFVGFLLSLVVMLILYALRQNISLFYTPTQIVNNEAPERHVIRVGGMVVQGSVKRDSNDLSVQFQVSDYQNTLDITYVGILPDLFREGQGIVVQGQLNGNVFKAQEVLAKHDENYMPPEVKAALKQNKTL